MKSFKELLVESQKTYKFKIRVAGELPEGFEDRLKIHMKKFEVVSIGAGKRAPITERPLDFPQLQNIEVTTYEVEIKYPTTSHILEQYVVQNCMVPHSHVTVRGEFDPIEEQQSQQEPTEYQTLLTTEDMGGVSDQPNVGVNRVMDLLKELEVARKEREIDPMEGAPVGESKDIDDTQNTKSPIGS
jgi:NACalpha-BTF3-like transcription factor